MSDRHLQEPLSRPAQPSLPQGLPLVISGVKSLAACVKCLLEYEPEDSVYPWNSSTGEAEAR